MQRKRRRYNTERIKYYLHSIPKLLTITNSKTMLKNNNLNTNNDNSCNNSIKNVKSNVLYSIPSVVVLVFLFGLFVCLNPTTNKYGSSDPTSFLASILSVGSNGSNSAYAAEDTNSSAGNGTTATLKIDGQSSVQETVPTNNGIVTYSNMHTVTVDATNISSYDLIISGPERLTGPSGSTDVVASSTLGDNTWAYGWGDINTTVDNLTYYAMDPNGATLTGDSINGTSVSFSRNLAFAAKLVDNTAGHYTAEVTLSLVATPRVIFSGITTMQEMTPAICTAAEVGDTAILKDDRPYPVATVAISDTESKVAQQISNEYTVSKLPDGRCWMTQNLRLTGSDSATTLITGGTNGNSNTSGNYSIPKNDKSAFNTNDATQAAFLGSDNGTYEDSHVTGYYSWCAATAGTCASAPNANDIAPSSICPKGWRLPTGGRNYTNGSTSEFYNLIMNGILKDNSNISSWKNNVSSNHYFTSSDAVDAIKGSPYNFAFTGYVNGSSYSAPASYPGGYWWSSTAYNSSRAYLLYIDSSNVYPGTNTSYRRLGYAVRCVAE